MYFKERINSVDKMENYCLLKQVGRIVITGLERVSALCN
jgi:hypothetical protein